MVKRQAKTSILLKNLEEEKWEFDVKPREILDFFMNPPVVKDYSLKWNPPDVEKIKKILCDEHDFSEDRIQNTINKLEEKKGTQSKLDAWVK